MTLIGKVSALLKKYYPDSSETKSLKLRQNAKRITDLLEDPLLWMRVAYEETAVDGFAPLNAILHLKLGSLPENKVKEITARRLEVLDAAIADLVKQGRDLSYITGKNIGTSERRRTIFESALSARESRVICSRTINGLPNQQAKTDGGNDSQCRGVVVDMYPSGESWEGYLVDWEGVHRGEVYKFEIAAIKTGCTVLSIGDVVTFRASSQRVVNSSLCIVEYFPEGLKEDYVRHFLKELVADACTTTSDPVKTMCNADPEGFISQVLEALPLWKGLLNEERLYRQLYKEILLAYLMWCTATDSPNAIGVSSPKQMEFLSTLAACSFIRHLPEMLQLDPRQSCDQETESFQQDLKTTSRLLRACLPFKESYTLAEALKCLTKLLSKPGYGIEEDLKCLSYSVLNECTKVVQQSASDTTNCLVKQKQASAITTTQIITAEQLFPHDPLFWLQLLHSASNSRAIDGSMCAQLLSRSQLARTEEIVKRRSQALNACECDPAKMGFRELSALVIQYENQVFLREVLLVLQMSPEVDEEESCGPALQGVVSDLYPTEGDHWKGYIVCPAPAQSTDTENEFNQVFQFDSTTTGNSKSCNLPVHIGDTVAFRPSKANTFQVANATLQVVEYFPGVLNEANVLPYLNLIKRALDNIKTLHEILQYAAVWKYLLNEPTIYQKHYQVILRIYKTDDSTTVRLQQKLMGTLKDSSFIQDLVALLEGDTRPQSDEQYREDVRGSAQLLLAFAQCLPNNAHTIVEPLKRLTELLSKLGMHQELNTLVIAIIDNYLIPPDSEKVKDRPWKYIPIILTRQEFEESINFASSKHSPIDLPVVKDYGRYESAEEYGRTYFNLLRADCYDELIDTVAHLKTQHTDDCHDCKFYYITYLGLTKGTGHRIVHSLQYETTVPLQRASSSNESSPLRQGDLVCFSTGGKFENDLIWATVNGSQHISSELVDSSGNTLICKGLLQVELCSDANDYPDEKVMELLNQSKNTVAVESPAYFRAYQPVLEALKTIDISKIHFIGDLLEPSSDIKSEPEIIEDSSEVDVSHLYHPDKQPAIPRTSVVKLREALEDEEEEYKFCLDRSQRDAVYKALSQSLSVIQGPPGTGKTYIALKLLQLFLSLSTLPRDKPIIIMAYKNRALDHILEECMLFCPLKQIVRIGHVSKGYEHMEEMTLRMRTHSSVRSFLAQLLHHLYRRVQMASKEVEERSQLSLKNCLPSMSPQWLKSLLLDTPEKLVLPLSTELKQKIRKNPQKYLCLLMEHTVMGKQDKGEKSQVQQALTTAWDLWTKDPEQAIAKVTQAHSLESPQLGDFEEEHDYETIEEDRCMAADDDLGDEVGSDVLKLKALSTSTLDTHTVQGTVRVDDDHVWDLTFDQRKQLITNTIRKRYSEGMKYMKDCLREYNEVHEEYELERQQQYLEVLKKARVVGMTTTGAAILQELLNKLKAPVVFVEEAAEVLESNLLATLTPHVKHLVLIGDHKQLKPQVASHKLRREYKFNTSMFERLVKNNFPYTLLMRQSRMHPQFVKLFSYHYSEQRKEAGQIKSSKRVHDYEHPSCMASPIFWWSYSGKWEEKRGPAITNKHEAEMVAALCLWLLSQKTMDEQRQRIQVLTPYRAQIDVIYKALEVSANQLTSGQLQSVVPRREIEVSTVDEFQGHESDIIILCLVRSNRKQQIGFLKEKNRLVVGTSRQKRGLYIIGNAKFLKETSTYLWKPFIERLDDTVGDAIPIKLEGKQYNCHSPEELRRAACHAGLLSCVQDGEDRQQPDEMESDSPIKRSSSLATTPLNFEPLGTATAHPLRQQSSPPTLNLQPQTDDRFRQCILDLLKSSAVKDRKLIGRRLGVSDPDIDRIEEENEPNEAFYQIMKKWHEKEGEAATPQKLKTALHKLDLKKVTETVTLDW